jgi:ATP-dependent DNA helicase RecG
MHEDQNTEKKSLRIITGKTADWKELAKDAVCFANARGGKIFIGIEDHQTLPPADQIIDPVLPSRVRKRIAELTINVSTIAEISVAENGGECVLLTVQASSSTVASTTDGKYYMRISDDCKPILPDDLNRLFTDKPAYTWETRVLRNVSRNVVDQEKLEKYVSEIRKSKRVSDFVKQKSSDELMDYYLMAEGEHLTNLGVLWIGRRTDRAKLLYAPVIQFIKYDENDNKVNKIVWDDFSLNPKELIEAVWSEIPDWKEGIEVSDGLFQKFIPNYEEEIIRELIANALVHRPYTTRGDIFINLFPDRLEVHNPGLLPIGVTPKNILHKTIRRNEHLAKVFYDLLLMEREGLGYDRMYEVLLSNGKQLPELFEDDDRVMVTVRKGILRNEIVKLISRANQEYQLRQREIICLGLIAQHTTLSAIEFSNILNLQQANAIRDWMGRLQEFGLVKSKGKTKGMVYFVNPEFLRKVSFKGKTNLKKIEDHRLRELVLEDLKTYPGSSLSDIHQRIGKEIKVSILRKQINKLIKDNLSKPNGSMKFRTYSLFSK